MNASAATVIHVDPRLHDALWARFVAPVLDGSEAYVHHLSIPGVEDPAALFPLGAVTTVYSGAGGAQVIAAGPGWAALASRWGPRDADVWLRSGDPESLAKIVAEVRSNAPVVDTEPGRISIDFWQIGNSAYTISRAIEAPGWADIADHYPAPVRAEVEALMATEPTLHGGRIILWHGPPGTGKTTAVRALARTWQRTATFQIVLDPDAVLGRAATLMEVLLDDDTDVDRWRVLVIEDADELIRADAKDRVGQSLSRLLNVGDGIVGQGVRVLVLITTNEPVGRLHPALSRPGRCLAQTEFRRFTRAEARAWRGDLVPAVGDDFSLAELLADPGAPVADQAAVHTGQYL